MITKKQMRRNLMNLIEENLAILLDDSGDGRFSTTVRTFEDVGLLTRDEGIIITVRDKSELEPKEDEENKDSEDAVDDEQFLDDWDQEDEDNIRDRTFYLTITDM